MGALEWVLDNRGVLPVLPRVLLRLGKVAPLLEGVVVKVLRGRRASRK